MQSSEQNGGTGSQTNQAGGMEKIQLSTGNGSTKDYTIVTTGDSVTLSSTGSGVNPSVASNHSGNIAVLTVGGKKVQLQGRYTVTSTGNSLNLSPDAPSSRTIPAKPAKDATTVVFSLSTPGGTVAVFRLFYYDGAIGIDTMNQAAETLVTVGGKRNFIVASALLAAQDKLGVGVESIEAAYVYQM